MQSFLNKRLTPLEVGGGTSSSFSIWWVIIVVGFVVAGVYLWTKKGGGGGGAKERAVLPPVPAAPGPSRGPARMYGRSIRNPLDEEFYSDAQSFQPASKTGPGSGEPPVSMYENEPPPSASMQRGGGGPSVAAPLTMDGLNAPPPTSSDMVALAPGTDMSEIQKMGMPTLRRTDARNIDFDGIKNSFPKK